MAIRIVEQRLCDLCLSDDRQSISEVSIMLHVEGQPAKVIEVCTDHLARVTLVAALGVASEAGRPPLDSVRDVPMKRGPETARLPEARGVGRPLKPGGAAQRRAERGVREEWCPLCWERFESASPRARHFRDMHGLSLGTTTAEFLTKPLMCPLCGDEWSSHTAVAQHLSRTHEMTTSKALWVAKETGDPHGVVSSLRSVDTIKAAPEGQYRQVGPASRIKAAR